MNAAEILPESFFARDALDVAHDLIGCWLRRDAVTLRITEVEAYRLGDSACHAWRGETPRNRPLFGPPGRVYMYLCYGVHRMLNIVTGQVGGPEGVLIRSAAPVAGAEVVFMRRGRSGPVSLTGPGKISQALDLDLSWSGHPLFEPGGLEILRGETAAKHPGPVAVGEAGRGPAGATGEDQSFRVLGEAIEGRGSPLSSIHSASTRKLVGPRVGIDYALPEHRDAPWRIAEAGTPWVSVRRTLRPL